MKTLKLPNHNNWQFWVAIALIVKVVFLLLKIVDTEGINILNNTFGFDAGDTSSYIEPIEYLLLYGEYFDDFRMPGYGWLYFLLRLFNEQSQALNLLIVLQVLCSALSVYILGLISLKVFKHQIYFYLSYFIYLISTYVSIYDSMLLTESFCASSIILSIYFLLRGNSINYFISGLFITWSIFLKPVYSPLLIIFLLFILLDLYNNGRLKVNRTLLLNLFSLYLPFIILDGSWIYRNYQKYNKIIPLTKSSYYSGTAESYQGALYRFMNAFGGSIVHWEPGSEITFFVGLPNEIKVRESSKIPDYIYTSQFNLDSLYKIRDDIMTLKKDSISTLERNHIEQNIVNKLDRYACSIKKEKPYLYYIKSRLSCLKTFFFHYGTYNLFNKPSFELNILEMLIKIFYSILYILVAFLGLISLIVLSLKALKKTEYFLISSIGLYSSLVFPIGLKMDEFRYFVPAYPIFVISLSYILIHHYNKLKKPTC